MQSVTINGRRLSLNGNGQFASVRTGQKESH